MFHFNKFCKKSAIFEFGELFTPSHKSFSYFATYVNLVLQSPLKFFSTYSWLDHLIFTQIKINIYLIYYQLHCTYTQWLKLVVFIYLLKHYEKGYTITMKKFK